jgi:serine protease AprX
MVGDHRGGRVDGRRRGLRRIGRAAAALLVATLLPGLAATPASAGLLPPLLPPPPPSLNIIVQQLNPADPIPAATVALLGGTVTQQLPIVTGFAATIPSTVLSSIAGLPGVRVVSGNQPVVPASVDTTTAPGPSVHREAIGSAAANASGLTGAGTTVAVIDTGIADVPALAGRVRSVTGPTGTVQRCVNLSNEAGCNDSVGHGTFVAGMVNSVAPGADLLSIKLSGRDGTSNVSTVLAAMQWVITNRSAYGIKVVNLSMRSDSSLSYRLDPLNLAVEQLWANGITVVVSAGNQGSAAGTIAKPGDDPWVITVGSSDDHGTASTDDDTVSSFSSRGPTFADGISKPDVVAPGQSLHSLRSPGSQADLEYPNFVDDTYRLGSGTSFSAPEVAGAAALLHQAAPTASNDRLKFALM